MFLLKEINRYICLHFQQKPDEEFIRRNKRHFLICRDNAYVFVIRLMDANKKGKNKIVTFPLVIEYIFALINP